MTELNEVKRGGERSDSTPYPYDEDLPYVVPTPLTGTMIARFKYPEEAERYAKTLVTPGRVIDTTPKPRVPDDARFITWWSQLHRQDYVAKRVASGGWYIAEVYEGPFEHLPGVTPETVFTVLDERKS